MLSPDALRSLTSEPAATAILLDVDGTLAPIVDDPAAAEVPEETRAELRRLSERYALVACVSGRPAADAARVVGVAGLTYVGEHGLELDPEAAHWADRLHELARSIAWTDAEHKPLTVSFHYRRSPDRAVARAELESVAERAREAGFVPRFGRMVLEIRPPVQTNKGTAVRHLLASLHLQRALYAGDDTTDLDAFEAVHELEVGVAIAVVTPESPAGLAEAADIVVTGGTTELLELLRKL